MVRTNPEDSLLDSFMLCEFWGSTQASRLPGPLPAEPSYWPKNLSSDLTPVVKYRKVKTHSYCHKLVE